MRKTTIFRSSGGIILGAALMLWGGTLQGQDTLQIAVEEDTTLQAQAQVELPDVHIVVEGNTLWDLSDYYFGDPLLWPEIYRLNTLVVEDPHWIFPGEELRLGPLDRSAMVVGVPVVGDSAGPETAGQVVLQPGQPGYEPPPEGVPIPEALPPPGAPPPPPPTESAPTVFAKEIERRGGITSLRSPGFWFRPIRRGEFYAAGFLTENQDLPWGKVLGAVGKQTLRNLQASSSALLYSEIEVEAPSGGTYQAGDSLLIAVVTRDVSGYGRIVHPSGVAVVTEPTDKGALAQVILQFGHIADGQRALPLEPFLDPGAVVPVPVENGMDGRILAKRDLGPLPQQQDIMFIDRGRNDGVALGDVFAVIRSRAGGAAPDTVGYLQIVHRRDRTSSGILMFIHDIDIAPESPVQLFRKMP
ncbi:MAG: LysM peptidoglycan-binding domain-containing protein [Gemmatimonadota bacterium]|nr:MAG: LysM peptidoglycan-binding domain-containing protein [Gemmatimonadota bacterium]